MPYRRALFTSQQVQPFVVVPEILRLPAESIHRAAFAYPGTEPPTHAAGPGYAAAMPSSFWAEKIPHQRPRRRGLDGGGMGMVRISLRSTARRRIGIGFGLSMAAAWMIATPGLLALLSPEATF